MRHIVYFILIFNILLSSCKSPSRGDNNTTNDIIDLNIVNENIDINRDCVILSQDIYDKDNYSLATIASQFKTDGKCILGFDITGWDLDDEAIRIYYALSTNLDFYIDVSHRVRPTYVSRRYNRLIDYADTIKDPDAPQINLLLDRIKRHRGDLIYAAGGHLTNFATMLRLDPDTINEHISTLFISTGIRVPSNDEPEMNLSGGYGHHPDIANDTIYVFNHYRGKIVISGPFSDNYCHVPIRDFSKISDDALRYLVSNGAYNDQPLYAGDLDTLLFGTHYNDDNWYRLLPAHCYIKSNGRIVRGDGDRICYYLYNTKNVIDSVFHSYIEK